MYKKLERNKIDPRYMFDGEGYLECPCCGGNYTHLKNIQQYSTDEGRLNVELTFYCESCVLAKDKRVRSDEFKICIQQHEGCTYLADEPESDYKYI